MIRCSAASVVPFTMIMTLLSCAKTPHYELSRFVSPETCGGCHADIYRQWKDSLHHLSHADPVYREVALSDLKGLTDPDEIDEAELCVKCHTPVGYVSGMPKKTSDHLKPIPELAKQGVQCDFCHSATGARRIYNAEIEIEPGNGEEDPGIKRGPRSDAEPAYHKAAFSRFHTSSRICGVCHDVRHVVFGTKLETPYEEWEKGPYASGENMITCQGCHMYQRPGIPATASTERPENPGSSAQGAPRRNHIFTHYFMGGNNVVPLLFGRRDRAKMAEERLKHAATVSIDGIRKGSIAVSVKNTGAGHRIPTGLSHVRQIWIELKVTNPRGAVLIHSGTLDTRGMLDRTARIYMTVFGDGKGNRVMNVAKARQVLSDRRIAPLERVTELYQLPSGYEGNLIVEARLWYRIAPQELVDGILGKGKVNITPVLMASDRRVLKSGQ